MCIRLVVSQPEIHVKYQYNTNRTATLILLKIKKNLHWLRHISQPDQRYLSIQHKQDSNTDLAQKHKTCTGYVTSASQINVRYQYNKNKTATFTVRKWLFAGLFSETPALLEATLAHFCLCFVVTVLQCVKCHNSSPIYELSKYRYLRKSSSGQTKRISKVWISC